MKFLLAVFLIPIFLTGCNSRSDDVLTIGLMSDIGGIPFIVAQQRGYLDESINLELFMSASDRDAAIQANRISGSMSDVLAIALAHNGGFNIYIAGAMQVRHGIAVGVDSGIESVEDLRGRSLGISFNTIIEYVVDSILASYGVDSADVNKISVPTIPSRLELLQNNQLDAMAAPEPHLYLASREGVGNFLRSSEDVGLQAGVLMVTADTVENKSHLVHKLVEAYNRAVEFINASDRDEFWPAAMQEMGFSEAAVNIDLPNFTPLRLPERDQIDNAVNWLLNRDLINAAFTFEDLVQPQFVAER